MPLPDARNTNVPMVVGIVNEPMGPINCTRSFRFKFEKYTLPGPPGETSTNRSKVPVLVGVEAIEYCRFRLFPTSILTNCPGRNEKPADSSMIKVNKNTFGENCDLVTTRAVRLAGIGLGDVCWFIYNN